MVFEDHGMSFQSTDPIIIQLCIGKYNFPPLIVLC